MTSDNSFSGGFITLPPQPRALYAAGFGQDSDNVAVLSGSINVKGVLTLHGRIELGIADNTNQITQLTQIGNVTIKAIVTPDGSFAGSFTAVMAKKWSTFLEDGTVAQRIQGSVQFNPAA